VRRFESGTDHITYLATGAVVRSQYRRLADGIRVYISTDITELVEKEQKQLATELAYRTKSQFLANMSHELRTPLNAILGFSELIRDATMGPVDARYRSYADDIYAAGQHLLNLINDILDLSKIEVGYMRLREGVVDIADVVRKCCRLVHERARDNDQTIEPAIPPDIPRLFADELRLKQIVINLLSNAIKFTPPGGHVRIAAASRADGGLTLSVADTGIGMRPEEIPTALTPFQQIDRGWRSGRDGTGLGLPLAKTLTELHGATFEIESAPGAGTIVTITMPADRVLSRDRWPARVAAF
jgi:two-component system cell cycle sensor histidine kinase PleC